MDTPRFTISPAAKPPGGNSASAQAHGGRAAEKSATILPLHRGAIREMQTTIESRYAEQGKRFPDERAEIERKQRNLEQTTRRYREQTSRPPLFERIGEALANDRFLDRYMGFVGGCFFTVGLAYVWSLYL
jgi:hypothetical protein